MPNTDRSARRGAVFGLNGARAKARRTQVRSRLRLRREARDPSRGRPRPGARRPARDFSAYRRQTADSPDHPCAGAPQIVGVYKVRQHSGQTVRVRRRHACHGEPPRDRTLIRGVEVDQPASSGLAARPTRGSLPRPGQRTPAVQDHRRCSVRACDGRMARALWGPSDFERTRTQRLRDEQMRDARLDSLRQQACIKAFGLGAHAPFSPLRRLRKGKYGKRCNCHGHQHQWQCRKRRESWRRGCR